MQRLIFAKRLMFKLLSSKTAKNTYFIFFGNSVSMVFAFFFTIILVRMLSISDFGYFSAVWTFILLTTDVADIGIGSSLSRFLPPLEQKKSKLFDFLKSAFLIQLVIAVFLSALIFLFSRFLSNLFFHQYEYLYLIKIASLGTFGSILLNFSLYALSARQKFISAAFFTAINGVLRVFLLLVLLFAGFVSLRNVLWIQSVTLVLLAILGFVMLNPVFLKAKFRFSHVIKLLGFSSYLGVARTLTALSGKLDTLMLISLTNSTQAGIYSTASRLISIYPLFSGSFTTVIAPRLALIKDQEQLRKFISKVILGTLGLVLSIIALIIFAEPFMIVLFGEKAIPAVAVFRVLLVSMIFFVGSIPAVSLAVYYLKLPKILTINSVLQVIIVIIGNLYFIPKYGKLGPSYSLVISYGLTFVFTTYLSYYYLNKKHKKLAY